MSTHQITHCTKLHEFWFFGVLALSEHHCKRMGVKRPSGWWDERIGSFAWENTANGCQNGSKADPLQTWVSTCNIIKQHNRGILVGFWALKELWWARGEGAIFAKISQKQSLSTHPDHLRHPFHPKFFWKRLLTFVNLTTSNSFWNSTRINVSQKKNVMKFRTGTLYTQNLAVA